MGWDVEQNKTRSLTIKVQLTGAFNASAISCAFWLILPFLVLIVLNASLKLFCRPCLTGAYVEVKPELTGFDLPVHVPGNGIRSTLLCHLSSGGVATCGV